MLKISIIDSPKHRRLVLEGMLVAPWAAEVKRACESARVDLQGRELVVEVKSLDAISQEGENVVLKLMSEGVKFRCSGVFTKHVFRELARRSRYSVKEMHS